MHLFRSFTALYFFLLPSSLLVFIKGEAKSTQDKRSALHLFRLGEAMLRIVKNKSRPLLHMMRAWSVVAPHLVEVWKDKPLMRLIHA